MIKLLYIVIATNRQLCKSGLNVVCNRIIIKRKFFAFGLPNSKSWKPFSKMLVTIWKGTTSKTKVLWRLLLLGVRLCREAGCYFCQLLLRTLYWPLGCNTYDTVVRRMYLDISCAIFVSSYQSLFLLWVWLMFAFKETWLESIATIQAIFLCSDENNVI